MIRKSSTKIIWVVGDDTNIGKTTISTALIRCLNDLGKATIGFKPYAGARLLDVIDLLEEIAVGDGYLVGRDARKLADASPLTPNYLLELVNPSWRLTHPVRDVSALVRKGSSTIGRRYFMRTENSKELWARPDLDFMRRLIEPQPQDLQSIGNIAADQVDFHDQDVQAASFKCLQSLGPEITVCEGAGRLLPVWLGAPAAQHLFFISRGNLYFFPDVGIGVGQAPGHPPRSFGPLAIGAITQQLQGKKHLKAPIPLAKHACLAESMAHFIKPYAAACIS